MSIDFSNLRVAVVGDLVLDRYIEGAVNRMFPEAPVPVLLSRNERDVLGGAANVVANVAALGTRVRVIGVIGNDEAGRRLGDMLRTLPGVEAASLIVDLDRSTTCKIRVVSGLHQIVRVDHETARAVEGAVEQEVVAAVEAAIAHAT